MKNRILRVLNLVMFRTSGRLLVAVLRFAWSFSCEALESETYCYFWGRSQAIQDAIGGTSAEFRP